MKKLLADPRFRETFRYLVCGVTTVAVNFAAYRLLEPLWGDLWANTAAFFIAVFYAYLTNSLYVFRTALSWRSFGKFVLMRLGTLLLDDGGLMLLLHWGVPGSWAKLLVNGLIIAVNYIISKLLIFRKKEGEP